MTREFSAEEIWSKQIQNLTYQYWRSRIRLKIRGNSLLLGKVSSWELHLTLGRTLAN
jgi:hypothetical protein